MIMGETTKAAAQHIRPSYDHGKDFSGFDTTVQNKDKKR
jgi:hypothetical protein